MRKKSGLFCTGMISHPGISCWYRTGTPPPPLRAGFPAMLYRTDRAATNSQDQ